MEIGVNWDQPGSILKTQPSIQVIPNALARRGQKLHDVTYDALRSLRAPNPRYLPWGPYPRLQIAALHPPTADKTSWDFTHIDPELIDYLEATKGCEPGVNFSSIPPWMFEREHPCQYPDDPAQIEWGWGKDGTNVPTYRLTDPSGRQLADYYARIYSWYTKGGFVDELGVRHESGHAYDIPWWGVLNEYDRIGPELYTRLYDEIVSAILKINPDARFIALELAGTTMCGRSDPAFFEYFLDPANHRPGIPIDMIAYHFYAYGAENGGNEIDFWQYSFFDQADTLISQARYIEAIRRRLAPHAKTYVSEIGSQTPLDFAIGLGRSPDEQTWQDIPAGYWNLSAALYAYIFIELAKLDVELAAPAGFSFYPRNYPGVSMVDWETGELNARFHVLPLIADHLRPGDRVLPTLVRIDLPAVNDVAALPVQTTQGRKLLLVNKRSRQVFVDLSRTGRAGKMTVVDGLANGLRAVPGTGATGVTLEPFAVAIVDIE